MIQQNKLHDFLLFNFLAIDEENAIDICEAGNGYIVPGIVASSYVNIEVAANKVKELKTVSNCVSIGLGGGGDVTNWAKVMEIAEQSDPGHINQPFEKASYVKGYLQGRGVPQVVNGLISPTGEVGIIQLSSGVRMKVEEFMEVAHYIGIESIKVMPVKGKTHLHELVYITKVAAKQGIRAVEPAGGIEARNIKAIVDGIKNTGIELFMPHIFGSTIDKETGKTIPEKVKQILLEVE
ncbi:KDGP aldolase [Salirhabdus salicampi]|uniref:KDGP aldolase n=1 Tax=Salirhabdus salicampi TaxID=476102 RepID=UPI0020C3B80F|nr:KDGP aldolase [Salirhabdus salicampi]MCP8617338.1 KDGP aldolase family protein [Salirhabdus salicampi]